MKAYIVAIADTDEMARTLDRYLRCCFGGDRVESYFMTYGRNLLSGSMFRQADLFLLELFRRDYIGYRAEAIPVAEKWISASKRVLIFSGSALSDTVRSRAYWDLSASEPLHERIQHLLDSPTTPVLDFARLRVVFGAYCRPAVDHHHNSP